jgi:hypothetical protein
MEFSECGDVKIERRRQCKAQDAGIKEWSSRLILLYVIPW